MKRISISPSLLDEYRQTLAGLWDRTDETLERYIVGPREDSDAMSRGRAYHLILEQGYKALTELPGDKAAVLDTQSGTRWIFTRNAIEPALRVRSGTYSAMLHEVWQRAEIEVAGYTVQMNMRLDALLGFAIHEFKTTGSQPTYLKYFDSLQWRCYLLPLPEVQTVCYTVFQLSKNNNSCEVHQYQMNREADNRETIEWYLRGLLAWLECRPHLLERLAAKAVNVD